MKQQIRKGVFETNSSSVHCMTMCSRSTYDDWKDGKLIYNRYDEDFETVEADREYSTDDGYYTYDEFWNMDYMDTFEDEYNDVVAFGYYGYDG